MRSMRVPGLVPDWLSSPEKKRPSFTRSFRIFSFYLFALKKNKKNKQDETNQKVTNVFFFIIAPLFRVARGVAGKKMR